MGLKDTSMKETITWCRTSIAKYFLNPYLHDLPTIAIGINENKTTKKKKKKHSGIRTNEIIYLIKYFFLIFHFFKILNVKIECWY